MNKPRIISIVVGLGLIIIASLWYGQHNGLLPEAAATEALLYDDLFNSLLTIAVAIFLVVQTILIYSIFKFRRRQGDNTDGIPIHDNFLLEIIWTAVPTVLVIWVGIYSFDVYNVMQDGRPMSMGMGMPAMTHNHLDHLGMEAAQAEPLTTGSTAIALDTDSSDNPSKPEPLNIDVQGMQFAWIFSYPDTEIQTSELHVPLGQEVKLNLSAADVIHAFWVPQFRLKQDTIPGMATSIQFTPNKLGTYPIVCAELCGSYHGGMRAEIVVETPEEYQAWLQQEQEELASSNSKNAIASNVFRNNLFNQEENPPQHKQLLTAQTQKMGITPETLKSLHHLSPQT
ncbi:heme/copper-type cytochrome/quinol oxidases, subunit 2 [Synechococcus sp. PCC 7502]|uniref:cytochrome c oxidase subunit II n=1 Tax=Synechococcus sp. PCC 7502 TaxID=1173263 RepID=UPI00029FB5F9|nr:cytochrome c oxidase subunit II [Synechococcus sp. PCC 7502]AFY73394.1 heme/copper-type cytochrome/quinol oxidases, subunit 2 [Synechococcus sp. PCC 7502]